MTSDFQPLMPEDRVLAPLLEKAAILIKESQVLAASSGGVKESLMPLLRSMNSYYTNKIEGQHTQPADIERALKKHFNADAQMAKRQRLALAHLQAESTLEEAIKQGGVDAYSSQWVATIHHTLYEFLPDEDCITDENEIITPGAFRAVDVAAGHHVAPLHDSVLAYLDVWGNRYRTQAGNERRVVAAVCAHHRLAWIHPFIDGNGRTARLHTHLLLQSLGLTEGLWSPMRGLARTHEEYYARLHNADLVKRNDWDGRGHLSQEELVNFAHYFLDVCIDQVQFMRKMLNFSDFHDRLFDLVNMLSGRTWQMGSEKALIRPEVFLPLHYVALKGSLPRADFMRMMGVEDRTARRILASLLDYGLLRANTSRADVFFNIEQKSLRWLFPGLWTEAELDS